MKRDNALPALVKANVENYRGAIALYLKQTEDNALVFIIGEAGAGKSYLAKLELPNALYPTPQQFAECDHISTMFTGFDVVIDDILRFDSDKVIECIQAVHALGIESWSPGNRSTLNCARAYCRVYQWVTALCFRR